MKAQTKTWLMVVALPLLALSVPVVARPPTGPTTKPLGPIPADPTKYDCRVTVAVRTVKAKGRTIKLWERKECPHKDKLAAGQCETSWLWGMRCKK